MTSSVDIMTPFVEWCDTPLPASLNDAHIVRFSLLPRQVSAEPVYIYYYGTLTFTRTPRRRFDGTGVAAIDPTGNVPFPSVPDFHEWFVRVHLTAPFSHPAGIPFAAVSFHDWNRDTNSAGTELRSIEADEVRPLGGFDHSQSFEALLGGSEWVLNLAKSTVSGI